MSQIDPEETFAALFSPPQRCRSDSQPCTDRQQSRRLRRSARPQTVEATTSGACAHAIGRQPQRAPDGAPLHLQAPPSRANHPVPRGAAACGELHCPHRGQHRIEVAALIKDEFDAFLECGILAHGFLRLRCGECGHDKLLAFSCKRRGFCPSCGARRMSQTAAHLVDHSSRRCRYGNGCCPCRSRCACCWPRRPITRHLQDAAERKAVEGHGGAVTLIQRFGSPPTSTSPALTGAGRGVPVPRRRRAEFRGGGGLAGAFEISIV